MKKLVFFSAVTLLLSACGDEKKESEATNATASPETATAPATAPEEKPKPTFIYPVKHSDWEIGDPNHINTVLKFYKGWDDNNPTEFADIFADTLRLRLPQEKEEILIPKSKMNDVLMNNRSMYKETSNDIVSAVSLHDKSTGENWVMITTYNKWVEKNGKRDGLLYHDNWMLKDGKVYFLMSFEKKPTKQFLKANDPAELKR